MKVIRPFAWVLGIAGLLTACGGTGPDSARSFSGQVSDYTGPAATLEARVPPFNTVIGLGSISADGSFTFGFVASLPDSVLNPIFGEITCPELDISNPDARGVASFAIEVIVDSQVIGEIALTDFAPGTEPSLATIVIRIYIDRDVRVTGTCEDDTYDLNLRSGWNLVSLEIDQATGAESATMGAAAGTQWHFQVGLDAGE